MSMLVRRLIVLSLGLLAGLTAWPVMELFVRLQGGFPSLMIFTASSGAAFGLIFGAYFATAEGIVAGNARRITRGAATGALFGLVGGAAGFLLGQGVLFLSGEYFVRSTVDMESVARPISRAVGWALLGVFVGSTEGIRARSAKKVGVGILGGFVGGLVAGAGIEYAWLLWGQTAGLRLAGLLVFGLAISAMYAAIEKQLSFGVLRVLNGRKKGTEFILNQRRLTAGSGEKDDIVLAGYRGVSEGQVRLEARGRDMIIKPAAEGEQIEVNDEKVTERLLKFDDVLRIGRATLLYKHE